MEVEFVVDRDTLNYGRVSAGQVVPVSKEDGAAFIANGVAKLFKAKKEKK